MFSLPMYSVLMALTSTRNHHDDRVTRRKESYGRKAYQREREERSGDDLGTGNSHMAIEKLYCLFFELKMERKKHMEVLVYQIFVHERKQHKNQGELCMHRIYKTTVLHDW